MEQHEGIYNTEEKIYNKPHPIPPINLAILGVIDIPHPLDGFSEIMIFLFQLELTSTAT